MPPRRIPDWLSAVRSFLLLNSLIYLYTGVLGLAALIVSFFEKSGRLQHRLARLWSDLILRTIMSPVTVRGLDHIDITRPHLYAVNHLSAMDIPVLFGRLPFQFRIIAKRELFSYPLLGGYLKRSGQIPVERSNALSSMRSLMRGVDSLKAGMPLVVFPEGGRSPDGHLQPFLGGAFYIAIKAKVDVVPMALVGVYDVLPMNTYHIRPHPIDLVVGEPISTADYSIRQVDALADRVRAAIEKLYYDRVNLPRPNGAPAAAPTQPLAQ